VHRAVQLEEPGHHDQDHGQDEYRQHGRVIGTLRIGCTDSLVTPTLGGGPGAVPSRGNPPGAFRSFAYAPGGCTVSLDYVEQARGFGLVPAAALSVASSSAFSASAMVTPTSTTMREGRPLRFRPGGSTRRADVRARSLRRTQDDRPLHSVAELADVSGPGVRSRSSRRRGNPAMEPAFSPERFEKVFREKGDVLRRSRNGGFAR